MPVESAYQGEDVPLQVSYTDASGSAVNEDSTSTTDPTGPSITITSPNGTAVVSGTVMSNLETGLYEFVWDTAASFDGTGTYSIEITGEFSSETKIVRDTIKIT